MRLHMIALAGLLAGSAVSSALAGTVVYTATLSGLNEAPPNASPGTGFAIVTIDAAAWTMRVQVSFAGLLAGNTASHIHCCTSVADAGTANVATSTPTFLGFPTGTTSGTYDHTYNMLLASSYRPGYLNAAPFFGDTALAFDFLSRGIDEGKAYLNIHSSVYPGGEIRGFLHAVPEPETYALMGLGLAALGLVKRRRTAA